MKEKGDRPGGARRFKINWALAGFIAGAVGIFLPTIVLGILAITLGIQGIIEARKGTFNRRNFIWGAGAVILGILDTIYVVLLAPKAQ